MTVFSNHPLPIFHDMHFVMINNGSFPEKNIIDVNTISRDIMVKTVRIFRVLIGEDIIWLATEFVTLLRLLSLKNIWD